MKSEELNRFCIWDIEFDGFNLFENLLKVDECLIKFGGHNQAAGITIHEDRIAEFELMINEIAEEILNNNHFQRIIEIDSKLKLKDINLSGTGLSALSNFRLTNASNVVVASSSSADATNVKFTSIASDNTAIAMDKSSTFYVIADTNSNTNTGSVQLALNSAVITGSNGLDNTTPTLV